MIEEARAGTIGFRVSRRKSWVRRKSRPAPYRAPEETTCLKWPDSGRESSRRPLQAARRRVRKNPARTGVAPPKPIASRIGHEAVARIRVRRSAEWESSADNAARARSVFRLAAATCLLIQILWHFRVNSLFSKQTAA